MFNIMSMQPAFYVLVVLCCLVLILIVYLIVQNIRLSAALKNQATQISNQQKELSMVLSASIGMGQRLSALQAKFNKVSCDDKHKEGPESDLAYARALRLLDSNADESTIMANSGLSHSEIRLMQLVNRPKKTV